MKKRIKFSENKSFYFITEIALIVTGILVALSIDNWNNERLTKNEINNYFIEINKDLKNELIDKKNYLKNYKELNEDLKKSLLIIKDKNYDSINVLLNSIGGLGTAWGVEINLPTVEEFIDLDLVNKIDDDSIRFYFKRYVRLINGAKTLDEYNTIQYNTSIEPFIIKNLNYSEVSLESYRRNLIQGGPKTDIKELYNNLEFFNILTFKVETFNIEIGFLNFYINALSKLSEKIDKRVNTLN